MTDLGKPNVLLVDPDPRSRRCLEVSLRQAGYCVLSAGDDIDASAKLHMLPPKLVLTELSGPKVDGLQFCKKIRSDNRLANTPVIFLTRATAPHHRHEAQQAGATDFIVKPTFIDDIVNRVDLLMNDLARHAQPSYRTSLMDTSWATFIDSFNSVDATVSVKNAAGTIGHLVIKSGAVIDAQVPGLQPSRALRTLLDTHRGILHVQPGQNDIAARLDIPLAECLNYQPRLQPLSIKDMEAMQVALHEDTVRQDLASDAFTLQHVVLLDVEREPEIVSGDLPLVSDEGWGTDTDWDTIAAAHQMQKFEDEEFDAATPKSAEPSTETSTKVTNSKWWKLH